MREVVCAVIGNFEGVLRCCKTLRVPEVWVRDNAPHLNNDVMETREKALQVEHWFAVSNSPWTNGTCERMMREVVRAVISNFEGEARDSRVGGRSASGPVDSEYGLSREIRKQTVQRHVRAGAIAEFLFLFLASSTWENWKMDASKEEAIYIRRKVANVVEAQQ